MSWHLICKSGRGAAFAFYDTLSRSLIYPSSLLLDVFLFPFSFFFFFVYTHTSGGDICGSGWGWNESRGKKREEGRKRGAECFWTPARVYAFFLIFFFLYLPAVYLARALSQQEETKNSSDGKSVVVDLHNSVVQKKKKKKGVALICAARWSARLSVYWWQDVNMGAAARLWAEFKSDVLHWQLMDVCYFQQVYDSTGQNELYWAGFFLNVVSSFHSFDQNKLS